MHGYIETCSAHVDTEFGRNRLQQVGDYKCKSLTDTGFLGLRKLREIYFCVHIFKFIPQMWLSNTQVSVGM